MHFVGSVASKLALPCIDYCCMDFMEPFERINISGIFKKFSLVVMEELFHFF